jgi:hypothetical protein
VAATRSSAPLFLAAYRRGKTWQRRADGLAPVVETPELIAREIPDCLEDRAAEGLSLMIETQEVDVEVEVAA